MVVVVKVDVVVPPTPSPTSHCHLASLSLPQSPPVFPSLPQHPTASLRHPCNASTPPSPTNLLPSLIPYPSPSITPPSPILYTGYAQRNPVSRFSFSICTLPQGIVLIISEIRSGVGRCVRELGTTSTRLPCHWTSSIQVAGVLTA